MILNIFNLLQQPDQKLKFLKSCINNLFTVVCDNGKSWRPVFYFYPARSCYQLCHLDVNVRVPPVTYDVLRLQRLLSMVVKDPRNQMYSKLTRKSYADMVWIIKLWGPLIQMWVKLRSSELPFPYVSSNLHNFVNSVLNWKNLYKSMENAQEKKKKRS